MTARKPVPKYGWRNIGIGSMVRYRRNLEPDPAMDVDCTLDEQHLSDSAIGKITDGPSDDTYGTLWEVEWTGVSYGGTTDELTFWWTYEDLLELV